MPAPSMDGLLAHGALVDELYAAWRADPDAVDPSWAALFASPAAIATPAPTADHPPAFLTEAGGVPADVDSATRATSGIQIYDLVHTYRAFGHFAADLDPLSPREDGPPSGEHPMLALEHFGFTERDLDQVVSCRGYLGKSRGTVREFLEALRETYCGPIGIEYLDVVDVAERTWLQQRIEPTHGRPRFGADKKKALLRELIAAVTFEETLGKMYPGAKRFSLEGATTLITLLRETLLAASARGVDQVVMGMAHRGRLNVLAHVLGKPLEQILAEFEARPLPAELEGYGDVKYHGGYSADWVAPDGRVVHLSLAFNPSHLETVDPVVEGMARAKQEQLADRTRARVLPLLIHGDAAFTGQGVVAETFTLAGLAGYTTGGTIHVILNNQIGFTTEPQETRSTRYVSDLAKVVRAPVVHVNADHPEAVALVAELAAAWRQTFHRDIVIDLVCFRRHGHNELDDPTFTQPVMARKIRAHPPAARRYAERLGLAGVLAAGEAEAMADEVRTAMQAAREVARAAPAQLSQSLGGRWQGIKRGDDPALWNVPTAVTRERLERIARALIRVPRDFQWHPRLERLMQQRAAMVLEDKPLDWGCGEALALGSILLEGTPVRFTGQDAGRGTFSHRHAIYVDAETGARHVPLDHLAPDDPSAQARLEMINSPLSEYACLGFEYGYSAADPWALVVWEAQFGDFANGAQIIVDQYLASAEYKWNRMSGLVLLLPHGAEGQGPEHSSARLERFLELCAEENLQVCNFTTPAQLFHALRRQVRREFRKPLIVMSPKSLLRHPEAVSPLSDFTDGAFHEVLDDPEVLDRAGVERVLLCSGKVYYALTAGRRALRAAAAPGGDGGPAAAARIAIVRLEQLYPFPLEEISALLASYPSARQLVWVQEEPRNMGGWRHLRHMLERSLPPGVALDYAGRDSRAVPATGLHDVHVREEQQLVDLALRGAVAGRRVVRRKAG